MKLFSKNRNKKNATALTDPLTVRMRLGDDFDPKNNADVQAIIDDVSADEAKKDGVVAIKDSWPFATFATAEDFLGELQTKIASGNTAVDFKEFAIWEYNPNEKYNPSSKGNGNPRMMISVPDFELTYDYQNLTKVFFEEIFNDPANDEVSYEDKVDYCNQIKDAYMESTNASENEVARIPSLDETNSGQVLLDVPAFSGEDLDESGDQLADAPVYDSATGQFIVPERTVTVPMPDTTSSSEPQVQSNQQSAEPAVNNSNNVQDSEVSVDDNMVLTERVTRIANEEDTALTTRAQQREMNDAIDNQEADARNVTKVNAPQFDVSQDLEAKEVGEEGYVEYHLNERKKYYNKRLADVASFLSESNARLIIKRQEEYQKLIKQAAAKYVRDHSESLSSLHDEIETRANRAKNKELATEEEKLDNEMNQALQDEERRHQQAVEQIKADTEANKHAANDRLTKKYNEQSEKEYDQTYAKILKSINDGANKVTAENERKYEIQSREDATTLANEASDRLQKMVDQAQESLNEYETQLVQNQLNGQQVKAAEQRAANEKRRINAPYAELNRRAEELHVKDKLIAQTQAERDALQNEVTIMKKDLEEQKRRHEAVLAEQQQRYDTLVKTKINDSKVETAKQVAQRETNKDDALEKLITLQLANSMQDTQKKQEAAKQEAQQKDANAQEVANLKEQLSNVNRGAKRALYGLGTVIVLGGFGGGYAFYHQNQVNAQRVASAKQATRTQMSGTIQAMTPSQVDAKATTALHDGSLKELNKYQTETYYDLDKAIINNDANAVNDAAKQLANLNLKDSYRAMQTENLLRRANNNDLATKVADANK